MNNASHEVIGKQSTFSCGKDRQRHNKPQFEYSFNEYASDSLTIKEFGFYKIWRMRGEIEGVLPTEVDNLLLDRPPAYFHISYENRIQLFIVF